MTERPLKLIALLALVVLGSLSLVRSNRSGAAARPAPSWGARPTAAGTFEVTAEATDALGRSANVTVTVVVIPSLLGLPFEEGTLAAGSLTVLALAGTGVALRRDRRRPKCPPASGRDRAAPRAAVPSSGPTGSRSAGPRRGPGQGPSFVPQAGQKA